MKIVIDLETTGFPERKDKYNYHPPNETKYYSQSRIVQIGYILISDDNKIIRQSEYLIKPDNFDIPNAHIHGITTEFATEYGSDLSRVLIRFERDLKKCDTIISHNLQFDYNILLSECYRLNTHHEMENMIATILGMNLYCTMKKGREILKLDKYPRLSELYTLLTNTTFTQSHTALDDAQYCYRCYAHLGKTQVS